MVCYRGALDLVIEEYQKKYETLFQVISHEKNLGLGKSLAIGLQACRNEYVARLDSDDIAEKRRCEKELEQLNQHPELDVVGSLVAEFCHSIKEITSYHWLPEKNDKICQFAKTRNPCAHSSIMMKKSKVLAVGNYRDYRYFEDYDLWIRMMKDKCQFYNIQEVLVYMRADENFYQRRGGISYLQQMLKFKTEQWKNGFYSWHSYLTTTTVHILVCLVPNRIRKWIYLRFLRKKEIKNKGT